GSFYPYEFILGTMLHELVHNQIGPHSAKFYRMLDQLNDECDKLIREGITGRNMPFAGDGQSLGGGRAPDDARAAALKAAEKRQRQQGIIGGGGQRLGGVSGSSPSDAVSAAQRAAAAAKWRHAVSQGCGGHHGCTVGEKADDGDHWECGLCTLFNSLTVNACDACGKERSATPPGNSIRDRGAGSSTAGRGGGSSVAGGTTTGREKRSAPTTGPAAAAAAAMAAGVGRLQKKSTAGARMASDGHSVGAPRGGGGGAGTTGGGGAGGGGGLPSAGRTWTCRSCPFSFPNASERRTCESCGAARLLPADAGSGGGGGGGGDGAATAVGGMTGGHTGWGAELLPSWTCEACTVVNPGMFLGCSVCGAERPAEEAAAAGGGGGGHDDNLATLSSEWTAEVGRGGGGGVTAGGWMAAQGSSGGTDCSGGVGGAAVGETVGIGGRTRNDPGMESCWSAQPAGEARVCRLCTLRNPPEASDCEACGIPLAESEAAVAATASGGETAAGAQGPTGVGGVGGSRASRASATVEGEESSSLRPGATAAAAA
ncbi:unnamed protein product, partial [Ectocarpus sp. 12 AP-2014]